MNQYEWANENVKCANFWYQESLKRRLQKLQSTNAKDKKSIEENTAALQSYEESFEKIFKATGNVEMDVDLLVKVAIIIHHVAISLELYFLTAFCYFVVGFRKCWGN